MQATHPQWAKGANMSNPSIPAAAVEAADVAYRNTVPTGDGSYQYRAIRAALEAAVPYMLASAWEEGESAGWVNSAADMDPSLPAETNPYEKDAK